MADEAFSQADIETLAARLNAMDFTDGERSILEAVFRATSNEGQVEGFDFLGLLGLKKNQQTLLSSVQKQQQDTGNAVVQKI
jgi:hypothetical protein